LRQGLREKWLAARHPPDDGTIFMPIDGKTPSPSQNPRLMPFAGERVTVIGRDHVRNGSHGLVIDKISK
jgi:hypothetical protein